MRAQVSLPAVAMAFAALPACVARVVIGCSAAAEVEANIAHMEQSAMVRRNAGRCLCSRGLARGLCEQ